MAMSKGPSVAIVVCLLVLAVVIVLWTRGGSSGDQDYYYDLASGDLVGFATTEIPPVMLPSGTQGVRAHVYACGDCATSDTFIGVLTKYSDEDKQAMSVNVNEQDIQGPLPVPTPLTGRAPQAAGGEIEWVPMRSPQGQMIADSANQRCGGAETIECTP